MNNELTNLDQILYGHLRPWLPENGPDEKYGPLSRELNKTYPTFQNRFEIHFHRPFNAKTRYYYKLIINEAMAYCNHIIELIASENDNRVQKYWINDTLNKKLQTWLTDTGQMIKDKEYEPEFIDPKKTTFNLDADHKTCTYIAQLLKIAFIQIYLEIQEAFRELIHDEPMIEADFYTQWLFEPVPEQSFLKEIKTIEVDAVQEPDKVESKPEQPVSHSSFTYRQYHTSPDKLTNLCDSLKKHKFIAQDTTASNFKKIFSGKEITSPVRWTGIDSEFYYFIKLIYTDHKLVENLKQRNWEVACNCFVQSDGTPFNRSKLRNLKRPKTTGFLLDKAVDLLK